MVSLNKITIIGNLGRDPEMRYTPQGTPVTTFSVAVNRYFNDAAGERQESTEWFSVVTWRQLAELCNQYLSKGRRAYVEGRFQSRTWQGTDGQSRNTNEIVADRVLFLDRASESNSFTEESGSSGPPIDPDDLPF